MAPLPNSSGLELSFFRAAGRHGADRKADRGAAQPGFPRAPPLLAGHPQRAAHRDDLVAAEAVSCGEIQRLADREEPDRHDDHVYAVEQLVDAEGEAGLAGLQIDADQTEEDAEEQARESAHRRVAEHRRHGDEGEHHQREILGRAEAQRELDDDRRHERDAQRADRPGDEGADRRGGERRTCAAAACHSVTLQRGDDRGTLTRRVQQNRGRRAAIHRAVIDAGEQNEGGGRVDLEGDRQ
jgi:hypothetical protein